MTKVEEAKAALWGQLVDSGELAEDDANVLLDNLVDAAHAEGNAEGFAEGVEFTTMELALDNCADALAKGGAGGVLPTVYGDALPIKET